MSKDFLSDRKKALEESFFARENAKLLEQLKTEKDTHETRLELAKVSGIESDEILDEQREHRHDHPDTTRCRSGGRLAD